jgi:integrase
MIMEKITNVRDLTLIALGIELGCRVNEMVMLRVPDIDFENQTVKVWDIKKKDIRDCVVTNSVLKLVRMLIETEKIKDGRLFPYCYKTANNRVKRCFADALIDLSKAHWHTLRHTYVVQSIRRGIPIKIIRDQTGDSLYTLLKYYSTISVEDKVALIESKPLLPTIPYLLPRSSENNTK